MPVRKTMTLTRPQTANSALWTGGPVRLLLVAIILGLTLAVPQLGKVIVGAVAEAYLAVGVFVAATFALFFGLERRFGVSAQTWVQGFRPYDIPVAAALGAFPGCGGAVMVITRYAMGRSSFGAVVAVLTSTMGDAAFLMLAQQPVTGAVLILMGFVVGCLSGYVVDFIHGPDFLRVERQTRFQDEDASVSAPDWLWRAWGAVAIPGFVVGLLELFQWSVPTPLYLALGVTGGLLSVGLWALSPSQAVHLAARQNQDELPRRVALNTNFVTVWVVLAFVLFEVLGGAATLSPVFRSAPEWMIVAAILVGFLPGCGPQILVTTLYLSGVVPFSAQLGNAISNDGDALFPALAVAPRAAFIATLYTAVPALLVAYGYFWLFEASP
ncbi:MAG: putative manganese transporter [Myxococcota bacterium]